VIYCSGMKKKTHKASSAAGRPDSWRAWHFVLIAVICIAAFSNSLGGEFVWDDEIQVLKNWRIRDWSNLPSAFTSAFWSFLGPGIENQTNYYRPVQTVSYMVAYAAGGLSPVPYHVLSVMFHIAASFFVYLLGRQMWRSTPFAVAAAAIFAAHPIHTEAVAWIAGIPDVSCGAFYFAAFWAFIKYRENQRKLWQISALALFFVALLCKEMAVTLPLVLVLLQTLKAEYRLPWRENIRSVALFGIPVFAYLGARVHALGLIATSQMKIEATPLDWISLAIRAFAEYIRYSVAPYPLKAFHVLPVHFADATAQTMWSLIVVSGVIGLLIYARNRFPDAVLWFLAFSVMLIPVFYFKGISYAFVAERYLYIPSFAMIALVLSVIMKVSTSYRELTISSIVVVFALASARHNEVWANDERLYSATLEVQPEVSHMRINLADIHLKRQDDAKAKQLLESALGYLNDTRFAQFPFEKYRAHIGLGAVMARSGQFDSAVQHFETAIRIQPNGDWGYLYLGGVSLERDKDYKKAMEYFAKAIELGPLNEVARDYMGVAMLNQGNYREAIANFEEALKINPTYQDGKNHLALAMTAQRP
jgi:protein O-mannosyl-transferase